MVGSFAVDLPFGSSFFRFLPVVVGWFSQWLPAPSVAFEHSLVGFASSQASPRYHHSPTPSYCSRSLRRCSVSSYLYWSINVPKVLSSSSVTMKDYNKTASYTSQNHFIIWNNRQLFMTILGNYLQPS